MGARARVFVGVIALVPLVSGVAACAADEKTASGGDIPVGVDIELSGPASVLGGSYRKALELVAAEANKTGVLDGRRIRLVIRDNKSDPAEAVRVAKNLWDNEKIVAMIGPGTSPTALPVVDEAERRKVPLFTFGSSGALVNPVDRHRYTFKIPPNNEDMARIQVSEIIRRGLGTAGYLAPSDAFGDASLKAFDPAAREAGLAVTGVERFNPRDTDFTVAVTKLLAGRPQAIAVAAITPASSLIAKAIRQAGFTGPVVYEGGAGAELFVQGAAGASEGMSMVFPRVLAANELPDTNPQAQAQKRFFAEYTRRYGEFSGFAPFAADAFAMIVQAIKMSQSADPEDIRDEVEARSFGGLTGWFSFSPSYHGGVDKSSLVVLTVRNGQWTLAG